LSSATTSISSISAITPTGRDLIHGNVYSMRLSYRDQAQNVPGKQFFGRRVVLVCCTCARVHVCTFPAVPIQLSTDRLGGSALSKLTGALFFLLLLLF
jgi:hypothetical protein